MANEIDGDREGKENKETRSFELPNTVVSSMRATKEYFYDLRVTGYRMH